MASRISTLLADVVLLGGIIAATPTNAIATPSSPVVGPAAKHKHRPSGCAVTRSGSSLIIAAPFTVHGQRFLVNIESAGSPTGPRTASVTLSHGHRTLLSSQSSFSAGTFTLTTQFGAAFHGVRSIDLASTDGKTVTGTIDGRALKPFTIGSNPDTIQFADEKAGPNVKVKPLIQAVLKKAAGIDLSTCGTSGGAARSALRSIVPASIIPGLSDCELCQDGCSVAYWLCGGAATGGMAACEGGTTGAGTAACVPAYVAALAGCEKAIDDCDNACVGGDACCSVPCAGGLPHAASPTEFCKGDCGDGQVCCGGASNPHGVCCSNASDCCGGPDTSFVTCTEGTFSDAHCVDQNTGALCFNNQPGEVCETAQQAAGGFLHCCPGDAPVCRDINTGLCCAQGAGDICGNGTLCCPANTPTCARGTCCAPQDVCGAGGDCCPSPHTCVGTTCCNPPSQVCTGLGLHPITTCCAEGDTCNTLTGICCPALTGIVCGLSCCDGATQRCAGGACCPINQACGNVCCPAGQFCADSTKGTCSPCPSGQVACVPPGSATPVCCPSGENCCPGGPSTNNQPVCCGDPIQQTCCGVPDDLCHTEQVCIP